MRREVRDNTLSGAMRGEGPAMPLYEYVCRKCSNFFVLLQQPWDADAFCPKCGSSNIIKKLSAFNCGPSSCDTNSGG
jgi:putative FmdB family regulatory protein